LGCIVQTSEMSMRVPLHGVCGYAPGGIPAYSNGNDDVFTAEANYDGHFFTGYQWQCVEFARRWLLERKGLVLPEYFIAAHIIHGSHVYHLDGKPEPCHILRNGLSLTPPCSDSIIVYPSRKANVVGHVGVIVEATESYVRVADQNRYFHNWEGKHYSAEFPVEKVFIAGSDTPRYFINDPEARPVGWLCFCDFPNRPDSQKLVIPDSMKAPPKAWFGKHLGFLMKSVWEHYVSPKTAKLEDELETDSDDDKRKTQTEGTRSSSDRRSASRTLCCQSCRTWRGKHPFRCTVDKASQPSRVGAVAARAIDGQTCGNVFSFDVAVSS